MSKKKKKFAGLNPREFNHPRGVYLHPGLRQVDFHRQFFPSEHIGVVGLSKNRFQCFELVEGRRAEVSGAALAARGSPAHRGGGSSAQSRGKRGWGSRSYLLQGEGGAVTTLLPAQEPVVEVTGGVRSEGGSACGRRATVGWRGGPGG